MKLRLTTFDQCRMILRAASWMVPRRSRTDWRQEWEGELAHAERISRRSVSGAENITGLRRRCCGAFLDAGWHRFNRKDLRRARERWARTPGFQLAALTGAFLLLIAGSGGLPRMRLIFMPPPYANPLQMVTVSGAGVVDSSQWMVPDSWIEVWRMQGRIFEGLAAYSGQPQVLDITVDGKTVPLATVQVENSLFSVFGVNALLGSVRPQQECANCFVLSYESWRRAFRGDANILRKNAVVNGNAARIVAVLPQGFWFPSDNVGLWHLSGSSFAGDARVSVVARLREGITERKAAWQMKRSIANMTGDPFAGSIEVWRVQERVRQPLTSYALALFLTLLLMGLVIWSGRLNVRPQRNGATAACRWWAFFTAKTFLLLASLLAAVVEFAPEPYVFPAGRTTLIVQSGLLWLFSVGCVLLLRWSIADQQRRCRVCLQKLALPAHIGRSGCWLLAWAGTELVCSEGHGLLHITETDVCWLDPAQWTQLDASWESLFADELEFPVAG